MRIRCVVFFVSLLVSPAIPDICLAGGRGDARFVDSLVALMTVEEKAGQLSQYSAQWTASPSGGSLSAEQTDAIRKGRIGSLLNMLGAAETRAVQTIAIKESRLKIPLIFGYDVIHGYRTTFPIPLAEACTWDPSAVERSARVAAVEAAASGIHWVFAPMVDIARDPRWGRIAEGSGEDPYLGAHMAAARVRGFQGDGPGTPTTVIACAKHFAAYGGAEGGRDYNTVDISERTLRETYLPPFQAAARAGVGSFMASFNEIGGTPSTANRFLLTDILRGEWKFDGMIVSDWNSVGELQQHGIAADVDEAALRALVAGTDMDMEGNCYRDGIPRLVKDGKLPMSVLDEAVRRVLMLKARAGLFDDPYRYCDVNREKAAILAPEHRASAREVARKSIVLLKNDGPLLPLAKDLRSMAVIGALADSGQDCLGPWAASGKGEDAVTVLAGIKAAVSPGTAVRYERGCGVEDTSTAGFNAALDAARGADAVVLVLGESALMSGEARCRSSIALPGIQQRLLEAVHAVGKPTVLVLMNGRPLAIPWAAEHVSAIVEGWFLGVEMGHAVADVLFGDANPSGKLTASFPRSGGQIPIHYNHKRTGRPPQDTVLWTSKYLDLATTPQYAFGHGLSYTTFAYSGLSLSRQAMTENDTLFVSATVKNTGARAGDEVAQLYIQDPVASITRPVKELRGYRRVTLNPGQSTTVTFPLTREALAFYGPDMKKIVEPGLFKLFVGGNSVQTLTAEFSIQR
jgi:beta-glucosidase